MAKRMPPGNGDGKKGTATHDAGNIANGQKISSWAVRQDSTRLSRWKPIRQKCVTLCVVIRKEFLEIEMGIVIG